MPDTTIRPEDLPAWMQPRRAVLDWGAALVVVACLIIALPLITRHAVPLGSDAEMVELRSAEVAHVIRSGILFSRWGPDLTYGFGSPLFNYLAPLPYYLTAYHQTLTDATPADSVNLFLGLSIIAAGLGMYLFARQRWGAAAGIVAAFVYAFSPPLAQALSYQAGDLASMMALGLLPWIGWSVDRLVLHPQRRTFALAGVLLAALIVTDARIAALALLVMALSAVLRHGRRYVVAAFVCAVLLAGFYWLPALLERDQIRWTSARIDERADPITPAEMLGLPADRNFSVLNPILFRGVGVGTWLLALVGAGAMVLRRESFDHEAWLFLGLGLIFLLASSPILSWLWPAPDDFQPLLPYHALLIAVFCLAIVGAQSVHWLNRLPSRWQAVGLAALCLIPAVVALIRAEPSRLTTDEPTYLTSLQAELRGYHIGTFTDGFLLPADAPTLPAPPPNLLGSVQVNSFSHLNRGSLPVDSRLNIVDHGLLSERYVYQLPRPADVQAYLLYYPGWSANVNGQRQSVRPSASGLVTINLPTVSGEIQVWLEGTPLRYMAWLLSATGIAVLLFLLRRIRTTNDSGGLAAPLPRPQVISLALAVGMYVIVVFGLAQRPDLFATGSGSVVSLQRSFQDGPRLSGYQLSPEAVQPDSPLTLTLYWQTAATPTNDFQSEVQMISGNEAILQVDHRHPGAIPTSRWLVGDTIRDEFTIQIPAGFSAGVYQLQASIGQCDTQNLLACSTIRKLDALGSSAPVTIPITVQ